MSASQSRVTDEINLDEFERRLRAAGAQQAQAEDPLAELSRLVEFSHMGIANGETAPARRAAEPVARAEPLTSIETEALRPSLDDEVEDLAPGASEDDRAARRDYEFDARHSDRASAADESAERRPMRWKLAVSALALAGVAMIGAVFALKHGVPGLKKDPPFIAAAQGPTKVAPPSDQTVSTSSDAGASLLKDNGKPAPVKVVNSEEQPVDLNAQASVNNPPPASADQAQAPAGSTDPTALAATLNTPLVPPTAAAPPKGMTSEFPDPKPVRTISLRPDGTPIGAPPPDQTASEAKVAAAPPAEPPSKPAEAPSAPAPKATSDATGGCAVVDAQDRIANQAFAAQVVGARGGRAKPIRPRLRGPPRRPANRRKPTLPRNRKRPPRNRKPGKSPTRTRRRDRSRRLSTPRPRPRSGGWSVQLAAPKSEAEAQSAMTRLNSKYSAELNGSPIGVHKAQVNGETIYRLRVSGLTKADAAAMCARLKGEGGQCFIAK